MKRFFFPVLLVAIVPLLLSSKCAKDLIPPVCFDQEVNESLSTNATSVGTLTITKTIDNAAVIKKLTDKGVNVANVTAYNVSAITVVIPTVVAPAVQDFTFADVSSAEMFVNDVSLGKLNINATGLSATFTAPAVTDFKNQFLVASTANLKFVITFKKAVATSTLAVKIPANTCYQL